MCPHGPFSLNAHQPPYSCMSHFIGLGICFMTQLAVRTACLAAPSRRDTGVEHATSEGPLELHPRRPWQLGSHPVLEIHEI